MSRDEELKYLKLQFSITCWQIFTAWAGPEFIVAGVLGSYVFLYGEVSPQQIFGVTSITFILGVIAIFYF